MVWDVRAEEWMENYDLYVEYTTAKGQSFYIKYKGKNLGSWSTANRYNFNKGDLEENKVKLLNNCGFIWDPDQYQFDLIYDHLEKIFKKQGHLELPSDYFIEFPIEHKLEKIHAGNWFSRQRKNRENGTLSAGNIQLLDAVNFYWDVVEDKWNYWYSRLAEYKDFHGDCNVPDNSKNKKYDKELVSWIRLRRQKNWKRKRAEVICLV